MTAPKRDFRGEVAAIRRSRLHPRRTDRLYLHLRRLRDDLGAAIAALDVRDVLDVYCGARPYEPLFPPGTRYIGFDIDDAYGCADVVSEAFLPFDDASFDLCLCTQAFYFVPDPQHAVAEFRRVLRVGGHVLLTQPIAYPGTERLYTGLQLRELFRGWDDVQIVENGRTVVSIATLSAHLLHELQKRLPRRTRPVFSASHLLVNLVAEAGDALERRYLSSAPTLPTNLLLHTTKPPSIG